MTKQWCVVLKHRNLILNSARSGDRVSARLAKFQGSRPPGPCVILQARAARSGARTAWTQQARPNAWKEDSIAGSQDDNCNENLKLNTLKALTRRLMAADTVDGLVQVVQDEKEAMNERHVAIALHRLSKLCNVSAVRRSTPNSPLRVTIDWLCEWLISTAEAWPTVSISNVVVACARLRLRNVALLQRAEKEALDNAREWKVGDILTLLHAFVLTRKYMPEVVVQVMEEVAEGDGDDDCMEASPPGSIFLAVLEEVLVKISGSGGGGCALDGKVNTLDSLDRTTGLSDVRLRDFSNDQLRTLSWVLYQLRCSNEVADQVLLEATRRTNLSPATIGFVARLSTEQGSFDKSLSAAVTIAMMITKFLESMSSTDHPSPFPKSIEEDASVMVTNFGKIVRKAADMSLSTMAHNKDGKPDQGLPKWTGAIEMLKKDNYSIDFAIKGVVGWVVQFVPKTNALGLSSLAYGLAQMQVADLTILRAVERRAIELLSSMPMEMRQISTIVWSLAILRYDCPVLLEMAARVVRQQLEAEDPFKPSLSHSRALTMILHGLAMLDRWGGEECAKLFPLLVSRIESCLPYVELNALSIVGWGIVVAHRSSQSLTDDEKIAEKVALKVLQTWRGVVADRFSQESSTPRDETIPPQPLSMLHHVEASIRIEYPELGASIPSSQYESFLQILYDSGRMRGEAHSQWKGQVKHSITPGSGPLGSTFQTQVYTAACELADGWEHEYWDPELEYPIDVALPRAKLALEADGPTHFTINNIPNKRLLGASLLKRRLLSKLGWSVISVPYYEWPGKLGVQKQVDYLLQLLDGHGISIGKLTSERPDVPCESSKRDASIVNNQSCRDEGDNLNLVVQRASRLDIVNYQRGKLSRTELAKRHAGRRIITEDDDTRA